MSTPADASPISVDEEEKDYEFYREVKDIILEMVFDMAVPVFDSGLEILDIYEFFEEFSH